MMIISKQEFVNIINKLKQVNDFVNETNTKAKQLNDAIISDFFNASSLSISHEIIVVRLLTKMFNDRDTISWWIYELEFGTKYIDGCFTDEGLNDFPLSSSASRISFGSSKGFRLLLIYGPLVRGILHRKKWMCRVTSLLSIHNTTS